MNTSSTPLASSQPHCLSILLQLGDQAITLLHNIRVLLVLVIGSVRLYDLVDTVNRAWYAVCGDEFGEVT